MLRRRRFRTSRCVRFLSVRKPRQSPSASREVGSPINCERMAAPSLRPTRRSRRRPRRQQHFQMRIGPWTRTPQHFAFQLLSASSPQRAAEWHHRAKACRFFRRRPRPVAWRFDRGRPGGERCDDASPPVEMQPLWAERPAVWLKEQEETTSVPFYGTVCRRHRGVSSKSAALCQLRNFLMLRRSMFRMT